MAFAPLLITAIGAVAEASSKKSAADYNASVMDEEGRTSGMQSNEATNTQLRQGNMALGRSTAAAVESGGGIGGSTGAVLHQSATNAELDALNVRYAGLLRQQSYSTQAGLDRVQGQDEEASALAGGASGLLRQSYGAKTGTYATGGD